MIQGINSSVNPFSKCSRCGKEIIPGFGKWRVLDLDGEPHDCPALPETGGTIQECARCERLVWIEPDGSKSEYGLRPILNDQGEIVKIAGLGQAREPHRCRPEPQQPQQSPLQLEPPPEHLTGSGSLSELESTVGRIAPPREET